jgi:hypothetical protein
MVTLDVRGGSTGKPDRLQDQDRWTKLLPVIEKTIEQVSELRAKGQNELAGALVELTRETLRRFDERLDIEQFLPPKDAKQVDPALAQENQQLKQQGAGGGRRAVEAGLEQDMEKAEMSTAATLATSANPASPSRRSPWPCRSSKLEQRRRHRPAAWRRAGRPDAAAAGHARRRTAAARSARHAARSG